MMLAKIAAILMIVWFFQTAKEKGGKPFEWILIGLIGYWVVWWIVTLTIANPLLNGLPPNNSVMIVLLIRGIPAFAAIAAAILVRKKLLANLQNTE